MDIKQAIFYIGMFFFLRIVWRLITTVKKIFFGVPVTTERYGQNSWAVVTGCTEGIGKAVALELASREFNLVLISRNVTKLEELAKEIQERFRRDTRIIVFDFAKETKLEAYQRLYSKIQDLDISVLINNVGIAQTGRIDTIQSPNLLSEALINCYPIVLLTHQLIKIFEKRFEKRGVRSFVANLSSQCAIHPFPYMANYAATKVFDDQFTKSLYYEMKSKGIDFLSVEPGTVATPMNSAVPDNFQIISAENCARGILSKATSFMTCGGGLHDLHYFVTKAMFLDHAPKWVSLKILGFAGKFIASNMNIKPRWK